MKCGQTTQHLPLNARIFTAPSGRPCYLSGIDAEANQAIICYTDDKTFIRISYPIYLQITKE